MGEGPGCPCDPTTLHLQGMSVQLHVPYSEHAKAPVGPVTMGLPLPMDPKKLGKAPGPSIWVAQAGLQLSCGWGRG